MEVHFAEAIHRMSISLKGHFAEIHLAEWTFRRKLFILLEIFRLAKLSAVQFVLPLIGQFFCPIKPANFIFLYEFFRHPIQLLSSVLFN
jgi:hypothetical protein